MSDARRHIDEGRPQQSAESLTTAADRVGGQLGESIRDLRNRVQFADAHGPEAASAADTPWHGSVANGDRAEYRRMNGNTLVLSRSRHGSTFEAHINGAFVGRHAQPGTLRRTIEDQGSKMTPREQKHHKAAIEVKDLAASITSVSGREDAVRRYLADAGAAIEEGDTKTAYGALDLARRHALGEFGDNPLRPVLLDDKTEAWRPIIRLRDSVRATAQRDA